jgi:hypothetical protein
VVVETRGHESAPIILGRPFLSIAKAIIYADSAKICFTINDRKERFNFKKRTLKAPVHSQTPYIYADPTATPKKKNNNKRRNKAKQQREDLVWMVNTVKIEYDHLLPSPYLTKKDHPGVPTIDCKIEENTFYKMFCDIGSSINIMSVVTYKDLYGNRPLYQTYVRLQLADQTFRFPEGIAKDIMVNIRDHYVPTDFMILDIGDEDDVHLILGRPFFNTTSAIIYMKSGQIHF